MAAEPSGSSRSYRAGGRSPISLGSRRRLTSRCVVGDSASVLGRSTRPSLACTSGTGTSKLYGGRTTQVGKDCSGRATAAACRRVPAARGEASRYLPDMDRRALVHRVATELPGDATEALHPNHPYLMRPPEIVAAYRGVLYAMFVLARGEAFGRGRHSVARHLLARLALPPDTVFVACIENPEDADTVPPGAFDQVRPVFRGRNSPLSAEPRGGAWRATVERLAHSPHRTLRRRLGYVSAGSRTNKAPLRPADDCIFNGPPGKGDASGVRSIPRLRWRSTRPRCPRPSATVKSDQACNQGDADSRQYRLRSCRHDVGPVRGRVRRSNA